jgi:hypothetical protein
MNAIGSKASGGRRIAALLAVALLVVAPATWVAWSLTSASVLAGSVRGQSSLLGELRQRVAQFGPRPDNVDIAGAGSIYLPGETAAIAGAELQRAVVAAIESAGGRLVESEVARAETTEADAEPGRVDLRVSFDTEIVGLQSILFALETGTPILLVRSLTVQSGGAGEVAETESPPLRVVMLVGGYRETDE